VFFMSSSLTLVLWTVNTTSYDFFIPSRGLEQFLQNSVFIESETSFCQEK